jgi:hypothetical protein
VDLNPFMPNLDVASFKIRFRLVTDYSINKDGIKITNIKMIGPK